MDNLPNVEPLSEESPATALSRDDLIEIMGGLRDGWYRTRDLYPRYAVWAERKCLSLATPKTLGESIARELKLDRRARTRPSGT